jgi:acetolactate synthase-1/2/3 large subunit
VPELVKLAQCLGAGVLESVPNYLNMPDDHPLFVGGQGNEPVQNRALAEADVVLVVDSDVPWIPLVNKPNANARIFHIDIDPLKEEMPLWYIPATRSYRADAATALAQIHRSAAGLEKGAVEERTAHYTAIHQDRERRLAERERISGDKITPEFLTACVRRQIDSETVVLNEGITNFTVISDHSARTLPGTRFTSGASSLGWGGGAAIGMKLAHPEKTMVCLTGDGSYMFSQPSTVHWMARRYQTPFLHVVYNNQGWRAPKMSALAVHPDGYASKSDDLNIAFDPVPDYAGIAAAAGGAFARTIRKPEELEQAVIDGMRAVREEKRAAVLDVWLEHL